MLLNGPIICSELGIVKILIVCMPRSWIVCTDVVVGLIDISADAQTTTAYGQLKMAISAVADYVAEWFGLDAKYMQKLLNSNGIFKRPH